MARVNIHQGCVEVRVSWLERLFLGERSHKLELQRIREVDAHPRLPDLMVHWLGRHALWVSGVSAYEGQLIPSTRNPSQTLAITLDDDRERVFVELDDEPTDVAADRIREAIRQSSIPPPMPESFVSANVSASEALEGDPFPERAASEGERPASESDGAAKKIDLVASSLTVLGVLSIAAGVGAWLTQAAPSPLLMGAGTALATVTAVGYAVVGR
jgi:hypothetical protein